MIKIFRSILSKITFTKLSDEELVKKYLATHKTKYFDLLYKRHSATVYGKCLSMLNNEAMCKDALQDIFLKVLVNLAGFTFRSKFSTWIYSITYNHCIDVIRREGKLLEINDYKLSDFDNDYTDDADYMERKLLEIRVERLERILDAIPPKDKAILLLKYQANMSIKEIAKMLGKSESAIKMALKRAKERSLKKYNAIYKNE